MVSFKFFQTSALIVFIASIISIIFCFVFTVQHQDITQNVQSLEAQRHNNEAQSITLQTNTAAISNNNDQFININSYNKYIGDYGLNIIPSSWQELNEQQLCTVETASNSSDPDALEAFLKFIYEIQFTQDCDDPNAQFVIYDIDLEAKQGLGASILGALKRNFAASLMLNRTFLLTGNYDWAQDKPYCRGKDAMECYFLPVSNCNATRVLQKIQQHEDVANVYYQGARPLDCLYGDNIFKQSNVSHCKYKVIHINTNLRSYVMTNGDIQRWTRKRFGLFMMGYEALMTTFILRPQPNVRKIIYEKIQKSIRKSFDEHIPYVNTDRIVAFPIRASDKCDRIDTITGNQYTHKSEITCFTPLEYVQVMNSIHYFTNNVVDHVMFTSEDSSFLQQVIDLMKDKTVSNVSHWTIIRNTEDFNVGEGTTTYRETVQRFNVSLHDDLGTSLDKDHIVSAVSSLVFQVHLEPKYMVYGDSSTWLKIMWRWLALLNCNIEPQLHEISGTECVEMSTPGYLNRWSKYKFVKYPQKIWKRIRNEKLEPDIFVNRFGINITTKGWDDYCGHHFKTKMKF